jgi:hypothetical protein
MLENRHDEPWPVVVAVEAAAPWAAERAMMLEVEDAGGTPFAGHGGIPGAFTLLQSIGSGHHRLRRGGAPSITHPLAPPNVMAGARIMRPSEVVEIDI